MVELGERNNNVMSARCPECGELVLVSTSTRTAVSQPRKENTRLSNDDFEKAMQIMFVNPDLWSL